MISKDYNILDERKRQYRYCLSLGKQPEIGGHYRTTLYFDGEPFFVKKDGSPFVVHEFNVSIHKKVNNNVINGDKLYVYGKCSKLKGFLTKYCIFLKCDGVNDYDLCRYYMLDIMCRYCVFHRKKKTRERGEKEEIRYVYKKWEVYTPMVKDVYNMLDYILKYVLYNDVSYDSIISKEVYCVTNRENVKEHRKYTRKEIRRNAKIGVGVATDKRIESLYDKEKTIKENAEIIGLSECRIKNWRCDNKDLFETKEERVKRMYDPTKSLNENVKIIGLNKRTVMKYRPKNEVLDSREESMDEWLDKELGEVEYRDYKKIEKSNLDDDLNDLIDFVDNIDL